MPFGRCPVCGQSYHLNVSLPQDEWYRQCWPTIPVGDVVPGKCIGCWVPLRIGHQVIVRVVPDALAGTVCVGEAGVVLAIEAVDELAFVVGLVKPGVPSSRFRREELSYMAGQSAVTEVSDGVLGTEVDGGTRN